MNTRLWRFGRLTLGLLMLSSPVMAQTHRQEPDPCKDTSNMGQMNECAMKELQKTEWRLEGLLKQLGIGRDSPEQKAWEAYRDAQLAALYPHEDISSYGSVYPMCLAILKRTLTEGRMRDLKALSTSRDGESAAVTELQAKRATDLINAESERWSNGTGLVWSRGVADSTL